MAEGLDLDIERSTDAADLALRHGGDAEGLDEVLDAAGTDTQDIGLLDDREQGTLGSSSRFDERRQVAAITDPRDGQLDRAHPRIPASFAVAVAVGQAALGVTLTMGHTGQLGDLGLHHRLGEGLHALAQEVGVVVADRLAHRLEQDHPVIGHRVLLRRGFPNSNDVRMTRWPFRVSATPLVTPTLGT